MESTNTGLIAYKQFTKIYYVLLTIQVILLVTVYLMEGGVGMTMGGSKGNIFGKLVPFCLAVFFIGSTFVYGAFKNRSKNMNGWESKFETYKKGSMLRWIMMLGVNMLSLYAFYTETAFIFIMFFSVGIIGFLVSGPSLEALLGDFDFSVQEEKDFKGVDKLY